MHLTRMVSISTALTCAAALAGLAGCTTGASSSEETPAETSSALVATANLSAPATVKTTTTNSSTTTAAVLAGGLHGNAGANAGPIVCVAPPPAIWQLTASAPPGGSGAACTTDRQCASNEFCSAGKCSTSGLLQRDNIFYVAGKQLDVTVTIPPCTSVTDVLSGGNSLGGGGFDSSGPQYAIIWNTTTTFNGQPALQQTVRITLDNFGDGSTSAFEIRAGATTTTTASSFFSVARVAGVNALMRSTITETTMRTAFLTSMYKTFGDGDQVLQPDSDGQMQEVAHDLDWSALGAYLLGNQIHYTGTDLRIQSGQVVFSMKFVGDGPCGAARGLPQHRPELGRDGDVLDNAVRHRLANRRGTA